MKFAHMADIHIGAFRVEVLREELMKAFEAAIDRCILERVEFVIMAGDIFDSNIPDLSYVKRAAIKIHQAREAGIRFYVVYGSHDFSPNYSSVVDVLEGAGLFTKVERPVNRGQKVGLEFVQDPSGIKLCGLSGKKIGLDINDYETLDLRNLEAEKGLKVFVFHGAIEELRPEGLEMMKAMPASYLPKGFDYYAGGHVHHRSLDSLPGRENIAYPGQLFAGDFRDLETLAKGGKCGFYLVDFDVAIRKIEFVQVGTPRVVEVECSADGKSSDAVNGELRSLTSSKNVEGAIVIVRVWGELSTGRTSDIDFAGVRKEIDSRGALCTLLSYAHLSSKEQSVALGPPKPPEVTERELFEKNIVSVNVPEARLGGSDGVALALKLLTTLRQERRENEESDSYHSRIESSALKDLGIESEG